jgi:hypothetical protein
MGFYGRDRGRVLATVVFESMSGHMGEYWKAPKDPG